MLPSHSLFTWQSAIVAHRRLRNLPPFQADVLVYLGTLIDAGDCEPTDARLAAETGYGISTCQEARRRARALGLLDWQPQYHDSVPRRRRANRYWLCAPPTEPEPRPDLRRKRQPGGVQRARGESIYQRPAESLDEIRKRRDAEIAASWDADRASRAQGILGIPRSGIREGIPWQTNGR